MIPKSNDIHKLWTCDVNDPQNVSNICSICVEVLNSIQCPQSHTCSYGFRFISLLKDNADIISSFHFLKTSSKNKDKTFHVFEDVQIREKNTYSPFHHSVLKTDPNDFPDYCILYLIYHDICKNRLLKFKVKDTMHAVYVYYGQDDCEDSSQSINAVPIINGKIHWQTCFEVISSHQYQIESSNITLSLPLGHGNPLIFIRTS